MYRLSYPARLAHTCIDQLGLRPPIGVVAVAKACGVPVLPQPAGGPTDGDAFLAHHPGTDTWAIFVAPGRSRRRRRFSIAHELGHYLLHRELIMAGQTLQPYHEWEANEFAAELLMPAPWIRSAVSQSGQLQPLFDVSRTALAIRLERLGYIPVEGPAVNTANGSLKPAIGGAAH